jgi:hypothetical protein
MLKEYRECVKGILVGYEEHTDIDREDLLGLSWLCLHPRNYKDLLLLFGTPWEDTMIEVFCSQLRMDNLMAGTEYFRPTNIAKYAPTEKCYHDKKYDAVNKFCRVLGGGNSSGMSRPGAWPKSKYRKFITKLRKSLDIVETKMSSGRWDEIDVKKVPSLARKRYKNAFKRHGVSRKVKFKRTIHSNLGLIGEIDPCVVGHKNVQYDISGAPPDRFTFQIGTFFETYLRSRGIEDLIFIFGDDSTLYSRFWGSSGETTIVYWYPSSGDKILFISDRNKHYIEGVDETLIKYFLSLEGSKVSSEDYIDRIVC